MMWGVVTPRVREGLTRLGDVLEGQREREGRDEEIFYHSISSQDAAGLRNILFFPLLQIVS
jgi:hypothetical protein